MSLSAISLQFLRDVETRTGLPFRIAEDRGIQPPRVIHIQMARKSADFHELRYRPEAAGAVDYQIVHQCSFVLRHYAMPSHDRRLAIPSPTAQSGSLAWVRELASCSSMPEQRRKAYAEFLQNGLLNMLRSIPVGMRIDRDLHGRFPELHAPQAESVRRQLAEQATLLNPDVQKTIPPSALHLNLAVNAAFAQFCLTHLNLSGATDPCLKAGCLETGTGLFKIWQESPADPKSDQALVQAWADALGIGSWIHWIQ